MIQSHTHVDDSTEEPSFGNASTMPVTGACCGIRPSQEAMESEFGIDFSQAQHLFNKDTHGNPKDINKAT